MNNEKGYTMKKLLVTLLSCGMIMLSAQANTNDQTSVTNEPTTCWVIAEKAKTLVFGALYCAATYAILEIAMSLANDKKQISSTQQNIINWTSFAVLLFATTSIWRNQSKPKTQ